MLIYMWRVDADLSPRIPTVPAVVTPPFDKFTARAPFPATSTSWTFLSRLRDDAARLVSLAFISHPQSCDPNPSPDADRQLTSCVRRDTIALQDPPESIHQRPVR